LAKLNTPLCPKLPNAEANHGTLIGSPASTDFDLPLGILYGTVMLLGIDTGVRERVKLCIVGGVLCQQESGLRRCKGNLDPSDGIGCWWFSRHWSLPVWLGLHCRSQYQARECRRIRPRHAWRLL
jgi:hypothetical protein